MSGKVSPSVAARTLAEQHGLPFVELQAIPAEVSAIIPIDFQAQHKLVPFRLEVEGRSQRLHLAVADPTVMDVVEDLRFQINKPIKVYVAAIEDIESAIAALQGESALLEPELEADESEEDVPEPEFLADTAVLHPTTPPPATAPAAPTYSLELPDEWSDPTPSASVPWGAPTTQSAAAPRPGPGVAQGAAGRAGPNAPVGAAAARATPGAEQAGAAAARQSPSAAQTTAGAASSPASAVAAATWGPDPSASTASSAWSIPPQEKAPPVSSAKLSGIPASAAPPRGNPAEWEDPLTAPIITPSAAPPEIDLSDILGNAPAQPAAAPPPPAPLRVVTAARPMQGRAESPPILQPQQSVAPSGLTAKPGQPPVLIAAGPPASGAKATAVAPVHPAPPSTTASNAAAVRAGQPSASAVLGSQPLSAAAASASQPVLTGASAPASQPGATAVSASQPVLTGASAPASQPVISAAAGATSQPVLTGASAPASQPGAAAVSASQPALSSTSAGPPSLTATIVNASQSAATAAVPTSQPALTAAAPTSQPAHAPATAPASPPELGAMRPNQAPDFLDQLRQPAEAQAKSGPPASSPTGTPLPPSAFVSLEDEFEAQEETLDLGASSPASSPITADASGPNAQSASSSAPTVIDAIPPDGEWAAAHTDALARDSGAKASEIATDTSSGASDFAVQTLVSAKSDVTVEPERKASESSDEIVLDGTLLLDAPPTQERTAEEADSSTDIDRDAATTVELDVGSLQEPSAPRVAVISESLPTLRPAAVARIELVSVEKSANSPKTQAGPATPTPSSPTLASSEPAAVTSADKTDGSLKFSDDDLKVLDDLERMANGLEPMTESQKVKPAQMVASLIRLLIKKGVIQELEFLDELGRK